MDAPTVFVRNYSDGALHQSSQLDVVVFLRNKFAFLTFENDAVGSATQLPKGSGAGIAYGTIGRVGGVIAAVEYAGSFDTVESPPLQPGANAGQISVHGDTLKVSGTRVDGEFHALGARDTLPPALRRYTDKLVEMDSAFARVRFPFN